ncbi:protein ELYS isoform X2 [Limanda limanda]|uniref:protein ELYS isoform X2 n=1 Tax=Limanda limanda TaxID=27771 RepID=UPI0029C940B3|nr:protein ELYS isoform X2 [Limanda limanda]
MHDLTAQVTSSLLPFPGVTVDALGEDDIALDSVLQGNFTVGRSGLAWLVCGPHLEVVHAVTGERLSAYCFSGGGEQPPTVLAARDFSWLKRSGLLVGLEEAECNLLCLYDLGLSRVVKAVVIPGRITAIEPLVSYGGASTSTQHLHQSLRWFFGIAAVVTDVGHVLLVDLCLDDLSCSQSELEASALQVVSKSPAEIPRLREVSTRQGRHLCLQLNGPSGVGATALQYISRTNQLAVGFSNGYLQLWNMKTLKKEYNSLLEGGGVAVYAFTFQEPENDPRNCCYLWAVQSSQDLEGDTVSLRLLQLAFSERKCLPSGKILYEGLEYCEERYSQELSGAAFPLRAQTTNTRLLSCQTIEKFRPHPDRDDSMNEVASPDTSVSIFSWQVKAYGQGSLSTYIGVFDINRWYHAQMPDSLRIGESLQNCPYLAVWSLDPVVKMVSPHALLDVVVHDRSLSRGLPFTCPPPEQYFNPTTYNFDATCLLNSGIVHLTCSGYQKETLSFLKKAAPCSSDSISTSYSRCLMSGLLSSRLSDTQASSLSQEEQLDAILSTAVETSSLGLITGCIKQWTSEEQPGSALNLRYILDWAWNKVVQTKKELDGICAPLFDSSSNFTDPQTLQLLQHSQRLLGNLSTIFHCLLNEAQELTQKGLMGLINKNMVSNLISKYAQVVLWFCRTGLLPEGSDDDALQISRPFYTHSVISNYYTIRREELTRLAKGKWCADCLMIDGLVSQCGERLTNLWKRDEGGTGQYPPPTLHALLDIYLLENIDETAKHSIVIYLLLDVMHSFPDKDGASVHSFPSAFSIPVGLVKLVQGLWLLDHHGHQSSFELLLHPAASQCQFEWQHERVLNALMCQGQHSIALRYFHITKLPISSTSQAKLCLSVLLHNRCLIEAWSLVRQHSNRLNMTELMGFLYESCQELGLIKELLKLPLGLREQECLEKFLQSTGGLQNRELLMVHYLQQSNFIPALQLNHSLKMDLMNERDPKLKERINTRNSILDQYGKVLPRVQRKLAMERAKPYQHPYTIHREVSRPQPLSTITKRSASEKVMSRAGFINSVLTKIEEVWLGKGATPQSSPSNNFTAADIRSPSPRSSSSALPDPFLRTPITMTSKRKSRLMDLVVQPTCQSPQPLLSTPRHPSSWVSPKSISKAPELSLLQTPQVVKRARALAASGPVFSAFTPQSILRSSLRPTPVATPSASPGRSITPPLRSKESRITFIEEAESPEPEKGIRWTNGIAADSEISLLTRGPIMSRATAKSWSSQPADEEEDGDEEREQPHVTFLPPEGGVPSPQLRGSESESSSIHEAVEIIPSDATQAQVSLSFDTSQTSVQSIDTTLEFYDAPLSQEQEIEEEHVGTEEDEEVVTLNIKASTENEETEESHSPATEQTPVQTSEKEEEEAQEDEEVMEIGLDEEVENEEDVQTEKEDEQDVESSSKEDAATIDHEEAPSQVFNQVTEITDSGTEVESQDEPANAPEQEVKSNVTESIEVTQHLKPLEDANEPEEDLEQSTDLTEFVQQQLFGSDLSPPLTRSGIHNASQMQMSFDRESLGEVEEEEQAAVEPPTVFTSQKSSASVTSSEPTGTDSHSVVSVNDSEELSSPASEEEEDDDDEEEEESDQAEEEEEEEEDSGSEVEIIEEVKGNGRLPPLKASSVFVQQGHTHFLPSLSEQEAAEFSLIPPGAEMKIVEEDMEGDVVMVRLGENEEEMQVEEDEEQGSSYMELKPSTTLLVPLELVEGQHGLVDSAQLDLPEIHQTVVPDNPETDTHCDFSLMLDMDEGENKEADRLPIENNLLPSDLSTQPPGEEASEELVVKPDVILLGTDDQDTPLSEEVSLDDHRIEMDILDLNEVDGLTQSEPVGFQTDQQAEDTDAPQEKNVQENSEVVMLVEDPEPAPTPVGELSTVVDDDESDAKKDAIDEKQEEEDTPAPEDQEEPEENGPVIIDAEIVPSTEMVPAMEEHLQDSRVLETEELNREEVTVEEETTNTIEDLNREEITDEEETTNTIEDLNREEITEEEETTNTIEELNREGITEEEETTNTIEDLNREEITEEEETTNTIEELNREEITEEEETTNTIEDLNREEITEEEETTNTIEELNREGITEEEETKRTMEELNREGITEEEETTNTIEELDRMGITEEEETKHSIEDLNREEITEEEETKNTIEELDREGIAEEEETKNTIEELNREEITEEEETKNAIDDLNREEITEEEETKNTTEELNREEITEEEETKRTMEELNREGITEKEETINTLEYLNREEITEVEGTKKKKRGRPRKNSEETPVKQVLISNCEPEENPVPETTTSQKKKTPSTPTRRTTRGRRAVTFISPLQEEIEEVVKVESEMREVPATPRQTRTPRKTNVQASPPRRSTRKALPEPTKDKDEVEEAVDITTTSTSKASSPARRQVSQRTSSTRTTQRTQTDSKEQPTATEVEFKKEEDLDEEFTQIKIARRTSSKTLTSSKPSGTQGNTPRKTRRRIPSSSELETSTLEMLEEENVQEEVFAPPFKRSSRKMKREPSEMQPALLEEEEVGERPQPPSPGRATRQSNRISLNVYPQSAGDSSHGTIETENIKQSQDLPESKHNGNASRTNSRRPTRSKLWDNPEEDLPLLVSPLEVDSETPVADALIKRLQDEEKQEGGGVVSKMVRNRKRSTKSSMEQVDILVPEPAEDESSPGEHSIIYSPSRRRTRAHREEDSGPREETPAPVTRSRRRVQDVDPQDAAASEEDNVEVEKAAGVSKTRKTGKQTAKSKGVSEPPPTAEVDLISPLPSPADPLPRTQKRVKGGEVATSGMNLRRKRIMETVFSKPVTRRKKL